MKITLHDLLTDRSIRTEVLMRLRVGEAMCFPTDTVYGLGARADDDQAIRRVFHLKGRPANLALPILLADPVDLKRYAHVNSVAERLISRHWPGALTLVLRSTGNLAASLSGTDTLGFRCPDANWLRDLIRELGVPLAGTSANRTGDTVIEELSGLPEEIAEGCGVLIDGGTLSEGTPSTVVNCTGENLKILRQGSVRVEGF